VAAAFFIEEEFQKSGAFIHDLYKGGLGRSPLFSEFSLDRQQVIGGADLEAAKQRFTEAFVGRSEFAVKYQPNTTAESFVDALLANVSRTSLIDLSGQRENLLNSYRSGANQNLSRGLVLRALADNQVFKQAEYNGAFVLSEYFNLLRRDPDSGGLDFWLNVLNNREPNNYRGMVCSFITSREYQERFSAVITHTDTECGQK